MASNETFWSRLKSGKLPSMDVNTAVTLDQDSVMKAAAIAFIVTVLIIASFFVLRKQLAK
jgi:hypothetical protein